MSEYEIVKPCPFCGTDLSNFPIIMTVQRVHSDEYLIAKLERKHIIGSDADYAVHCIQCGAVGQRGRTRELAIRYWNRRANDLELSEEE